MYVFKKKKIRAQYISITRTNKTLYLSQVDEFDSGENIAYSYLHKELPGILLQRNEK